MQDSKPTEVKRKEGGLCALAIRQFVSHPIFEAFILFTILLNATFMAVIGPEPRPGSTDMHIIYYSSLFFTPLYTAEGFLKICGFGLLRDERSYFRDPWCIFDCCVILVSWIDLLMTSGGSGAQSSESSNLLVIRLVRFIRVLRVARAASKLSVTKLMVEVVVRGLYNSRYVFLIIFLFIIFNCTLGLSWFSQDLRYRCTVVKGIETADGKQYNLTDAEYDRLDKGLEFWSDVTDAPQIFAVPEAFCRHRNRPFPSLGKQCDKEELMCVLVDEAAFDGLLNFEDFSQTFLTVIMTLMQQEWETVMIATMEGTAPPACIFFLFIVVFGSLFLMEYTTAVLCITFVEVSKSMNERNSRHSGTRGGRDHFDQALVQVHLGEIEDGSIEQNGDNSRSMVRREVQLSIDGLDSPVAGKRSSPSGAKQGGGRKGSKQHGQSGRGNEISLTDGTTTSHNAHDSNKPPVTVSNPLNQEAFKRIYTRALPPNTKPTWKDHASASFDVTAYVTAGIVMYPAAPCEFDAAGGEQAFSGSDDEGQIAMWEIGITALSAAQVGYSLFSSTLLVRERKLGNEPPYDSTIQWLFLIPFILDMAIKLAAFKGPRGYMSSILNQMDFWVTLALFVGLLSWQRPDFSGFRVFRCLRVLSLSRWSEIGTLLNRAFGSLFHALNAVLLTAFFVVILAIIGQQIFAGANGEGFSRMYFGSFYLSLISMTELSTKSGLFQMIRQGLTAGFHTNIFLVTGCFLMNMIVLKLMIPLIVNRFEEAEAFKIQYQLFFGKILKHSPLPWDATTEHQQARDVFHQAEHAIPVTDHIARSGSGGGGAGQRLLGSLGHMLSFASDEEPSEAPPPRGKVLRAVFLWEKIKSEEASRSLSTDLSFRSRSAGNGDGLRANAMKAKKMIKQVLVRREFDLVMGFLICVAAVVAALCTSVQCVIPAVIGDTLEVAFTVIFSLELCAKLFAFGLFTSTTGYFTSLWNWLDFAVLITMWAGVLGLSSVKGAQSLRLLRLIRVIMLLRFFPAIRNACLGLVAVRRDVIRVFTLVVALLLVFTCFAMQMYGGLLSTCADDAVPGRVQCAGWYMAGARYGSEGGTGKVPVLMPRIWSQQADHFDDVGAALTSSFFLFLNYDWTDMMERSMSITGPTQQREAMAHPLNGMLFVVCQLVVNIMIWQLIVSVVISSVRHADGSAFQTEDQKAWAATKRQVSSKYEQYKKEPLRGSETAHAIASNVYFENLINAVIILNIGTMLSDSYGMSQQQQQTGLAINTGCLVVYFVEMGVVILANPINYFLDASKLFDFAINVISTVDAVSSWTSETGAGGSVGIQALKALRVLRIARMVNRRPAVAMLIKSTIKSFDRAMGCFAIWGVITLLFALWSVQLFAGVKQGLEVDPVKQTSFDDVPKALLWLFRISVGSNVFHVIADLEVASPACTTASAESGEMTDCGPGTALTRSFFIIFCFLCRFVLFPLVAGTIVNAFFSTVDDVRALISAGEIGKFETAWRAMDPAESGYIAAWKLQPLLEHLRSKNSVLWFDRKQSPGKMSKLSEMLTDEMQRIRDQLLEKTKTSTIHNLKLKDDPGLSPCQLRFDSVLLHLVAFSMFPHALHVPATEHICKVDKVCAANFDFFMRKRAGDIRRRILMAERAASERSCKDKLVHQQSRAIPVSKGSDAMAMPTPRDRLLSRAEAIDGLALENVTDNGSAPGGRSPGGVARWVTADWATRRDVAGVALSNAPTARKVEGVKTPSMDSEWNTDAITIVSSSEDIASDSRQGPQRMEWDESSDGRGSAERSPLAESPPSETVFLELETDAQSVVGSPDPSSPFVNRLVLDLALALDIKTDQIEIRDLTKQGPNLVRIVIVVSADPTSADSRKPRRLARVLRSQSKDPHSDLMVLIPQVARVSLQGDTSRSGADSGIPGTHRSLCNPDLPENVVLQRHALMLQQHLSNLVASGSSDFASHAAARTQRPRPREPETGDVITEGIKSIVGGASGVMSSLTPHVMPFLPGKRSHTYVWKGR